MSNTGVGYRASQKLAMQHARQFHVIGINCAAGGFFTTIGSGNIVANYCVFVTHWESFELIIPLFLL
jgi:hypothetical protein